MWSECMRRVDCGVESVDVKDERKEGGMSSQLMLKWGAGRLGGRVSLWCG